VQFKTFKTFKPFKPPPPFDAAQGMLSSPADAGESLPRTRSGDEGEGLNDWNFLNDLNVDYLGIELWLHNRQLLTSGT
jgi:hypothetical protein